MNAQERGWVFALASGMIFVPMILALTGTTSDLLGLICVAGFAVGLGAVALDRRSA